MNFFSASSSQATEESGVADCGLLPTPNYGTLGPGSDIAVDAAVQSSRPARRQPVGSAVAILVGVLVAGLVAGFAHSHSSGFTNPFSALQDEPVSLRDLERLDHMKPQKQAETLLQLAVMRSDAAVDQISSRVDYWHGKLRWDSQIATLTAAALNSNDMRVRASGVEVELAAYGLGKNAASLDYLLRMSASPDHAQKIWALWALGLLGNRGVGTDRAIETLSAHLKDADEDSRRWAIEGLTLTGANEAIPLLLQAMHDDASPSVRERAACALAESGMITHEQRLSAVPQLLSYTDDPVLDAPTHALAFRVLGDVTHEHLPNDSGAWRSWYETSGQGAEARNQ